MEYYIVSTKHTSIGDTALTLWRANGSGYTWQKASAGVYVDADRSKYESEGAIFVSKEIADTLFEPANDFGDKFISIPNEGGVHRKLGISTKGMKPKKYATCRMKF